MATRGDEPNLGALREALPATVTGIGVVLAHYLIFAAYLPDETGRLGHDYSLFLTHLLDGFFWYEANGPFSVPWFTPSFCGGVPKFPNPQSLYYSVPQLLVLFVGPVRSLGLTLLIFDVAGFAGCYLLQRRVFGLSRPVALLGATLFLFNTLYSSRMLVGHLTFHSFMLAPTVCYLLLRPVAPRGRSLRAGIALDGVLAGLLIAYVAATGMAHVLLPLLWIALFMAALRALVDRGSFDLGSFAARFSVAGVVALGVCAAQLVAALALLERFPRTLYPLPGVASIWGLIRLALRSLFLSGADGLGRELLVNSRWTFGRHEFEYGVGVLPLGMLILGAAGLRRRPRRIPRVPLTCILLLLALPLAMNYYSPGWNAWLKRLPILSNSSLLLRWFSVYIPASVVVASLALDRAAGLKPFRIWIAAAGIAFVVIGATFAHREDDSQRYDPQPVERAYAEVRSGVLSPAITRISVPRNRAGREYPAKFRNDAMTEGASQLLCYEPLFGYRLESFPRGVLESGPALAEREGLLNLKNPSCYVYPDENGCAPGDHFAASQRDRAEAFASYRPFPFEISRRQALANRISVASLGIVACYWIVVAARRLMDRIP